MYSALSSNSAAASVTRQSAPSRTGRSVLSSPACIVVAALAVRLAFIVAGGLYRLDVQHWTLFEMANIGVSLASGHGFASPFGGNTGPTAWTAPLYPYLVALAFRAFGVFSPAAAFALLTFNSIFSALTCWTIYRIARRLFNEKVAIWSGWIWALWPFAILWSVVWIWETTFSTFLLTALFMLTLEMDGDSRLRHWAGYGLLWGVVALSNTSAVAWLPFSGCWLAYRLYRARKPFLGPVVLSALVFWVVITPWIVRNYVVFDKLIFIRGDLGSELRTGNNPLAKGMWVPEYRAGGNNTYFAQYQQMGEVAYDKEQTRLAKQWIAEDPVRFLALSCRRVFYFWVGLPDLRLRLFTPLYVGLAMIGFAGLLRAARQHLRGVFLFASLIGFYPLIYYITFPMDRYHHPIEPELLILAIWLLVSDVKHGQPRVTGGNAN